MIEINGKAFARTDKEFTESLFRPSGTCAGFYRIRKNSVLFLDMQKQPFAHLTRNKHKETIFGNARSLDGKVFYQAALSTRNESIFGLAGLGYLAQLDAAENLFNTITA